MKNPRYKNGFEITLHEDLIELPLKWKTPKLIFVNSMSDLFHENIPTDFIKKVFNTMQQCPKHTFQILTKRSKRLMEIAPELPWPNNIWQGVTVENNNYINRIKHLKTIPSNNLFISFEPLIGEIKELHLEGIKWVIVGGESGPKSRPIKPEWVIHIRDYCLKNNIPFFFKQWGGVNKKKTGRLLENELWNEYPNFKSY